MSLFIDIENDYLRLFRYGYNQSGIFGIEFRTHLDIVAEFATNVEDKTLTCITEGFHNPKDKPPAFVFVGFAGMHQPEGELKEDLSEGSRIN